MANAVTIKSKHQLFYPFGEHGAAAMADSRDTGFFAAHCLSTLGYENKNHDITSPDMLSFDEAAKIFSREQGRPIAPEQQNPAEHKAYLGKLIASKCYLDAVCEIFTEIAARYVVETTSTFREITGHTLRDLAGFVREMRSVFTP